MGEAYFRGLASCLGLIVAIGAQNAFVLRQGLKREHVPAVVLVCGLCDTLLLALGVGGFGGLVAADPALTRMAAWGGAAFLGWYALRSFRAAMRPGALVVEAGGPEAPAPVGRTLTQAAAFSLLNPHVYLDTVVLVGSLAAPLPAAQRLGFGAGAVSASWLWFAALGFGARLLAPLFAKPSAWRALDLAVGCLCAYLALGLLLQSLG